MTHNPGPSDGLPETHDDDGGGVTWSALAPQWVKNLSVLASLTTVGGIALVDDPVAFLKAFFLEVVLTWVLESVGELALIILDLWTMFVDDVVVATGVALVEPLGPVGDAILFAFRGYGATVADLVAGLGPAAPFVVMAAWGLPTLAVAKGIGYLRRNWKSLVAAVIPWL